MRWERQIPATKRCSRNSANAGSVMTMRFENLPQLIRRAWPAARCRQLRLLNSMKTTRSSLMDQLGARAARPLRIGAGQRLALPTVPSVIVLVCLALAGCASSPVGSPSSGPSTGQLLMMGATTAGGAALGNHFNEHYGAPVGAAAGLGLGLLANQYFSDKEKRAYEEGYEQGRRDARVEVMKQYWY